MSDCLPCQADLGNLRAVSPLVQGDDLSDQLFVVADASSSVAAHSLRIRQEMICTTNHVHRPCPASCPPMQSLVELFSRWTRPGGDELTSPRR